MNKKNIDEMIGWYGAISIILAYALLNFGLTVSTNLMYQILNATGAIGIVYISFKKRVYQPCVLNVIWATIAIISAINIIF